MRQTSRTCTTAAAILFLGSAAGASAAERQVQVSEIRAEGIRDHVDEAEDLVDALLAWRHAITDTRTDRGGAPPTAPAHTLISVERGDVERIGKLVDAAVASIPAPPNAAAAAPRGDLLAHARKAQEIAREMLPASGTGPIGTSGSSERMVLVDRTALQRLDIELEAIERIAPRQLK